MDEDSESVKSEKSEEIENETENSKPMKQFKETYVIEISRLPGRMEDAEIEILLASYKPDAAFFYECEENSQFREARVTFASRKQAVKCCARLHKSRVASLAKLEKKPKSLGVQIHAKIINLDIENNEKDRKSAKKSRLIVRNLKFGISETKLKRIFSEFGTVTDVSIPTKTNEKGKKTASGFAFVQLASRWEAHKALKAFSKHDRKIQGRVVAVDIALPKDEYLKTQEKKEGESSESSSDEDSEDDSDDMSVDEVATDEDVESDDSDLVDSSSDDGESDGEKENNVKNDSRQGDVKEGKTLFVKNIPKGTSNSDFHKLWRKFGKVEYANVVKGKTCGFVKYQETGMATKALNSEVKCQENILTIQLAIDKQEIKKKEKTFDKDGSYDVHENKTIFARNLPYTTSNEDLKTLFQEYGSIRSAICLKDHQTGTCKGTGFVQFENKQEFDKLLAEKQSIFYSEREIFLSNAVDRRTARGLSLKKEAKDNRRIFLSTEGQIRPNTAAAEGVSEHDMNLREKLFQTLRSKLKNANMFMSDTRLVIHNIPKTITQDNLKDLIYKTVKSAKASTENIQKAKLGKIHVTLMKDKKGDSGKSLGYAFCKTDTPDAALLVLRSMNNSPQVFSDNKRPIVEFCCENRKALEIQQRRQDKSKEKQALHQNSTENGKSGKKRKKIQPSVEMESGKLFKYQGLPAQKRKKGEKLTIPRLKKKPRLKPSSGQNSAENKEEDGVRQNLVVSKRRDSSEKMKKSRNRKQNKLDQELKRNKEIDDIVSKYQMKLKS